MRRVLLFALFQGLLITTVVGASGVTLSGSLEAEFRLFGDDPAFAEQMSGGQTSLKVAPEWRWRSESRRHQFKFSPFLRLDGRDPERTHGDLREAYWRYLGDHFDLLLGVQQTYWGVTESRHLVDVINQVDSVEDIDGEDKLGQPMLRLGVQRAWGRLEFYLLPFFREQTQVGVQGRLRPPLIVDPKEALYESSDEKHHLDWALRWTHNLGDWDLGAHFFRGTGREPGLRPSPLGDRLLPYYSQISQMGLDLQYTREAWLWKLEALGRSGQGDDFAALVLGFEYTLYQLGGRAWDLGLLVEFNADDRDETAPLTLFDEDTFLGVRWAFNDIQDTQLLFGALVDHEDGSVAALLEGERRLGRFLTLVVEARAFLNVDSRGDLAALEADSFLSLQLAWNL